VPITKKCIKQNFKSNRFRVIIPILSLSPVPQEAQLLLGDRATRKHAKDSWKGRGNDNLGWCDLQMYFKVIKSGTNRKLVYDFLLIDYSTFCRITRRFWEIWCERVQWAWNMPKVIDSRITWKLSYVKCSEDSERMKRKSPFWTTPVSFNAPSPANPREYLHKPYTARNYVLWTTFLPLRVYG